MQPTIQEALTALRKRLLDSLGKTSITESQSATDAASKTVLHTRTHTHTTHPFAKDGCGHVESDYTGVRPV